MVDDGFLAELRSILTDQHVLVDDDAEPYARDWTGRWHQRPGVVVRPGTSEQVASIVRLCRRSGTAIVARGGNTGLVGGSVADARQVLIDLTRLDGIGPVIDGTVTVEAGVTVGSLQRHAAAAGWRYPVDFGARDSATIGGSIATNAGGMHVFRHGMTRAQVLGVEVIDGHGRLIDARRRVIKDNTGPSIAALMCGSEGTLGVVTSATLRLIPAQPDRSVALLAFASLDDALRAVPVLCDVATVEAIELIDGPCWAVMAHEFGAALAADPAAVIAVETTSDAATATDALGPVDWSIDSAVGEGAAAERLWRYRDEIADVLARRGTVTKFDVSVPSAAMADLIERTGRLAAADSDDTSLHAFGHAADGNLHLNLLGVVDDAALGDAVHRLVLELGGSVSAEHGVGRAKNRWLAVQHSSAELSALASLRDAFDPGRILNPEVLRPTDLGVPAPLEARPADPS